MVQLVGQKVMNQIVSHLDEVRDAVHDQAKKTGKVAEANLREARSSTRWTKIAGPSHQTKVTVTKGDVDSFVNLEGPSPESIEYGHSPSGAFGPGGRYGHLKTKSPDGLYILSRAAGLA